MRRCVIATAVTAVVVGSTLAGLPALAAPGDTITIPTDLATSSALAADQTRGVYWLAPGGPKAVAIDQTGKIVGQVGWDAEVTDIEALAVYNGQLYAGDLDSGSPSPSVTVYRVESSSYGSALPTSKWTFTYPDGPHRAQAMMVSSKGNIWIITNGDPGGLYYAAAPTAPGPQPLAREADAPAWVTDGNFVNANSAVLRTYNSVLSFDMLSYATTGSQAAPQQDRGESATMTLAGDGVLLGSVGDTKLVEAELPTVVEALPPAPSAPPGGGASATPSTEPGASEPAPEEQASQQTSQPGEDTDSGSGLGMRKTIVAVVLAVAVAGVSGWIAYRRQ